MNREKFDLAYLKFINSKKSLFARITCNLINKHTAPANDASTPKLSTTQETPSVAPEKLQNRSLLDVK